MNKILIPAILNSYRPLADKSFNVTFNTNVLTPEQKVAIDSLHQQFGFLMFKDSQIEQVEENMFNELEADLYDNNKTQSQRLRGVLYRNFESDNKGFSDFRDYYKAETEKIITHYKNKLS